MADTVNRGTAPNDPNSDTLYDAFGKINTAIDNKVDKVAGKGLSTNDFTNERVTELTGKQNAEAGKGLSTNDLTNTLKTNYDTAFTHSQTTHAPSNAQKNSDITKAEIEAKLTGNLTSHTHDAEREKAQSEAKSIVAKTGNFTLALTEAGAYIRSTASAGITCTVPTNATVAFPIKTVITIRQAGAGTVTCTPASGVTLNGDTKTQDIHKSLQLIKVDTDTWDVEGGTA